MHVGMRRHRKQTHNILGLAVQLKERLDCHTLFQIIYKVGGVRRLELGVGVLARRNSCSLAHRSRQRMRVPTWLAETGCSKLVC